MRFILIGQCVFDVINERLFFCSEDDKARLDIEWQSETDLANREKWYTIAGQVFIPFLIAGFGTVAAGLVLERSKVFDTYFLVTL